MKAFLAVSAAILFFSPDFDLGIPKGPSTFTVYIEDSNSPNPRGYIHGEKDWDGRCVTMSIPPDGYVAAKPIATLNVTAPFTVQPVH